jgi:HAD superfamily hydrolase (TIGR01459 family)
VTVFPGGTALAGLRDVAAHFDAFFIDQFGVLHDGQSAYPQAPETLLRLTRAGKQVVLLSNSGKRSAANEIRLRKLGFSRDSWTHFLSSGEVAWSILAEESANAPQRRRCLLLSRDRDRSAIDGLPIDTTECSADCDMVLIAGSEGDVQTLDHYAEWLAPAAARGVPAYCTNPDHHMLTPHGLKFGAGRIALLYEELGGTVTWIGKPFPGIYAVAQAAIRNIAPERILCIGDSVDHDIAGARTAGLRSCLIAGGIHEGIDNAGLASLYIKAGAAPDFVAPYFRW